MTRAIEIHKIKSEIIQCMVASCTCMTKTPEVKYHKENCTYRLLNEAYDKLDAIPLVEIAPKAD